MCASNSMIQTKGIHPKREAFQIFAIILPTGDVCLYSVFHSAWEGESALVSFDFPVHLHYSCFANLPDFITVSLNTYCSTEMLSSYRHAVLHFLLKTAQKRAENLHSSIISRNT